MGYSYGPHLGSLSTDSLDCFAVKLLFTLFSRDR